MQTKHYHLPTKREQASAARIIAARLAAQPAINMQAIGAAGIPGSPPEWRQEPAERPRSHAAERRPVYRAD